MKQIRLTKDEKVVESIIDQYVPVSKKELNEIANAIAVRKKDAVLNIRISQYDLKNIKMKSKRLGVRYQTLVSEILHRVAQV